MNRDAASFFASSPFSRIGRPSRPIVSARPSFSAALLIHPSSPTGRLRSRLARHAARALAVLASFTCASHFLGRDTGHALRIAADQATPGNTLVYCVALMPT